MKSRFAKPAIAGSALCALAAAGGSPRHAPPPHLAVLVVVDQLRADLLDRYDTLFTGGFRRLRDRGFRFTEARVDHAITISHPGHVTIATGDEPARHGIVDAAFYELDHGQWRFTDALADSTEHILGAPGEPGVSPRKILVSALPDWFVAGDSSSRVVAVGAGRYSSLLHGGKGHPDVYWYSAPAGRFVTSSYYRARTPSWLDTFNAERLPTFIRESLDWETSVPAAARALARRDSAPYEGAYGLTAFPHRITDALTPEHARMAAYQARWFANTPMLDAATLDLAATAVRARALGQRDAVDYLSIVVSQVDDIGHFYGPRSQEQLDNLLRLDRELGAFFAFLDRIVGRNGWTVAVTADHGTPDIPEYQLETGRHAYRVPQAEVDTILAHVRALVARDRGTREAVAEDVATLLERDSIVADAMTPAELLARTPARDSFVVLYRHNYRADRVPRYPLFSFDSGTSPVAAAGVAVRLRDGDMLDIDRAVHGSPYDFDRRVPIVFMGPGITPGTSPGRARTIDVAPTLAALAGVPVPPDRDGRVLHRADGEPLRR
ncbi:MAG TPA: alkaline phosphatase family protein [Gemmatimonadales bacterium]|nr:alkaline phosphatase family protein [Gemmatimonadales bacterium]